MKSYYLVYSQPRSTNFEVPSVAVVDQEIKQLKSKVIPMVKVLWRSDTIEEMSWEIELSPSFFLFLFFLFSLPSPSLSLISPSFSLFPLRRGHLRPDPPPLVASLARRSTDASLLP